MGDPQGNATALVVESPDDPIADRVDLFHADGVPHGPFSPGDLIALLN
jgi:hypothetical protein